MADLKSLRANRRGDQQMGLSLNIVLALVFTVGFLVVCYTYVNSLILEKHADDMQLEQLNGLVQEIKLACEFGESRSFSFTAVPARGVVFLRDLSDIERDKIAEASGACEQYCLCAIRRSSAYTDAKKKDVTDLYTTFTPFLTDDTTLRTLIADPDTKVAGCRNLLKAAPGPDGKACFKDVILTEYLSNPASGYSTDAEFNSCDYCKDDDNWKPAQMSNHWGLPLYWQAKSLLEPTERKLAILSTSKANCAWHTRLWIKKDTSAKKLTINSQMFNWYQTDSCIFFKCAEPTETPGLKNLILNALKCTVLGDCLSEFVQTLIKKYEWCPYY